MKFTLSWLKSFLDTDVSLEAITHKLTMIGLEVEDVVDRSASLKDFVVAEIVKSKTHPDADKLKLCSVKTINEKSEEELLQIVCGASNARTGIKVVLAKIGTVIPNGNFKIKKSKIRGIESYGMLCSSDELCLDDDNGGIIELPSDAKIGDNIAKYLGIDDPVIDINITPNRGDALGVYGIARDLAAAGVGKLKDYETPEIKKSFDTSIQVNLKDFDSCPIFTICEVKDLQNQESPIWLKRLLGNIGIAPISAIVDVTNYIAYSFGQPMHAYDADKISGNFSIKKLEKEEKFNALNEKEYDLQKDDIVIKDDKQIHCLGGIIGGIDSSCGSDTKRIFLEAAVFDADSVAKTGRNLLIDTDSRYRFERNVDKDFVINAQKIAINLIISICGGSASNIIVASDPNKGGDFYKKISIDFPLNFLESRSNIKLLPDEIKNILESLGFGVLIQDEIFKIEVPSWRSDISIKEDIVEELVRIYGYDKLPETKLPEIKDLNQESDSLSREKIIPLYQKRISDIKRIASSRGYDEVVTWSFMDLKKAELFADKKDELIIRNPISSDLNYMRPSILPNLLKTAHNNINRSFHNLSLFEAGPIFENAGQAVTNVICGIRTGKNISKNIHESPRDFDVFDIKSDFASILKYVGIDIDRCQLKNNAPKYYHPSRSASISLGKNILGYFGQVHPLILKDFDIEADVVAFELNISNLPIKKPKYGKKDDFSVSNYQMITRDYAFVIDKDQAVGELMNFIKNSDKKLVKSVSLFDVYSGDKIETGKKSVAISVKIQDNDKTLVEEEIESLSARIIGGICQKFSASLRDW